MTQKIKSVVLATGKLSFDKRYMQSKEYPYVLAWNHLWGDFVMNPLNVVNSDGAHIINFEENMAKFVGCKRKDELVCSRELVKDEYVYRIEQYTTLEKIRSRFFEKESAHVTEKTKNYTRGAVCGSKSRQK